MMRLLLSVYIVLVFTACNGSNRKKDAGAALTADTTVHTVRTGLTVEPLLRKADSLQILYYDDPDGDSLRYTRYYRYTITKDTATINDLLANLDKPVEQRNDVRKCRSEGKIYVFSGHSEEPLKTIYFSTRCDTCCYLYYIKEGAFYYSELLPRFRDKLKRNKALSQTP